MILLAFRPTVGSFSRLLPEPLGLAVYFMVLIDACPPPPPPKVHSATVPELLVVNTGGRMTASVLGVPDVR